MRARAGSWHSRWQAGSLCRKRERREDGDQDTQRKKGEGPGEQNSRWRAWALSLRPVGSTAFALFLPPHLGTTYSHKQWQLMMPSTHRL